MGRHAVYHHVGTGHTTSIYWCEFCQGFYGVLHDDIDHSQHGSGRRESCACRPCQQAQHIYPKQGVFMEHGDYLQMRKESS